LEILNYAKLEHSNTTIIRKEKKTMKTMRRGMKRDGLLQRVPRITATVLVTVVLLACATVVNAAEEEQKDKWRFTITPYLWLPSVSTTMKLTLPSGLESRSADIDSSLKFALPIDIEVRKGRWSIFSDFMYVAASADGTTHFPEVFPSSGGWTAEADLDLETLIFEVVGGYTVFQNEYLNFDLFAGVRYAGVDIEAELDVVGPLPALVGSRDFSESEDYIDPIVGFRGKFELGKKWFVPYYFDIGGFSVDSDLTLQTFAGIGYHFCDWFSTVLGYRYLYYDFGGDKLLEDMKLYGGMLGFAFSF
jgi:hypothetical protein